MTEGERVGDDDVEEVGVRAERNTEVLANAVFLIVISRLTVCDSTQVTGPSVQNRHYFVMPGCEKSPWGSVA